MNRGDCAHPTRCGSDGVRCSWLDCGWSVEGGRGWPPPKVASTTADWMDGRPSPWALAAFLVIVIFCAIAIYAGLSHSG